MAEYAGSLYVSYNRGLITGFSETIPGSDRYFSINALRVEEIKDQMRKESFNYLVIRENTPAHLSVAREGGEEDYIMLSKVSAQLMSEATLDIDSANDDLEAISEGRRVESRLETQFLE
jgi:hypothetical protein